VGRWEAESKEKEAGKQGSLENRKVGRSNPIQLNQLTNPRQLNKRQSLESRNKIAMQI
jgi:hypothetical protein